KVVVVVYYVPTTISLTHAQMCTPGPNTTLFRSEARIQVQYDKKRRRIYLVGIAKRSKVLERYRLAMALEGVLQTGYPAYTPVPRDRKRTRLNSSHAKISYAGFCY